MDKELEKRGHAFARYADDLNDYVRTKAAGERVYEGLKKLFGRLRLVVNEDKSAVDLVYREMRARGASSDTAAQAAANTRRWWRNSALLLNSVLTNRFFDELGVPRLAP